MTITLGFDIGTTRTKALVYDVTSRYAVACASEPTPVRKGPHGDTRDADEVWAVLARLCAELARAGAPLSAVEGVSIASLGEEIVFVDARGLPTGPVTCWYVEQPAEANEVDASVPPFRLASWYAIRAATRRGDAVLRGAVSFTDLGGSLLDRMAGSVHSHMDRSHASRTGLLDAEVGGWSADRIRSCGAERLRLPQLIDSGARIGSLNAASAAHLGLPAGIAVRSGAHDHIAAAYAAGAQHSGDVFVSVGTSESRLVLVDLEWAGLAALESPGCEVGFFVDGRHRYLHTSSPSGRRVAELVSDDPSRRGIEDVYAALSRWLTDGADDAAGAPELPPGAVEADPTAAELFAELDQQARKSAEAIDRMAELTGEDAHRVRIIGVPARHEAWVSIRRGRSDRPVEVVRIDEPAAVGAAVFAAGDAGFATDPESGSAQESGRG